MSPLHPILHEKFKHAFGEPHRIEGKDRQWGLRALNYVAPIHVLVNGSSEHPMVWVFDPHDEGDGVTNERIHDAAQIDGLILRIEQRVRLAGRRLGPPRI